jgi:hypothetical protein
MSAKASGEPRKSCRANIDAMGYERVSAAANYELRSSPNVRKVQLKD